MDLQDWSMFWIEGAEDGQLIEVRVLDIRDRRWPTDRGPSTRQKGQKMANR